MDTLAALPLTSLDWVMLAVLLVSMVVGLVRGLVFEALSLAGWLVAWVAAQWSAPVVAPSLPVGLPGTAVNHGAALALSFVAALLAWALLARLARMLVHATPLSVLDRLMGAAFGVLRGVIILLAVASVVAMTPVAQAAAWKASQGARILGKTLLALKPLLPESAARLLPT
jgi:membrane protein required for colicin V production